LKSQNKWILRILKWAESQNERISKSRNERNIKISGQAKSRNGNFAQQLETRWHEMKSGIFSIEWNLTKLQEPASRETRKLW
jgi:hypothetical protein